MDSLIHRPALVVALVVLLLAVVLVGQAATDTVLAEETFTATGAAIGQAGFAYLTGIRTFAAAVIWNRIDPIYHEYYTDRSLKDQTQALPMIKLVTVLSPDFVDAYSVGAWIITRRGLVDEGLDLAREGVDKNPKSGLLRVNYAQLLWLYGDDTEGAVEQADIVLNGDVVWRDLREQHDSYAVLRTLYKNAGQQDTSDEVLAEIERIDEELGDALPAGSHDHDGDGVPDH